MTWKERNEKDLEFNINLLNKKIKDATTYSICVFIISAILLLIQGLVLNCIVFTTFLILIIGIIILITDYYYIRKVYNDYVAYLEYKNKPRYEIYRESNPRGIR